MRSACLLLENILIIEKEIVVDYECYKSEIANLLEENNERINAYINGIDARTAAGAWYNDIQQKNKERVSIELKVIDKKIEQNLNKNNEIIKVDEHNYGEIFYNEEILLDTYMTKNEILSTYYSNGKLKNYIEKGNNKNLDNFVTNIKGYKSEIEKDVLDSIAEDLKNIKTEEMEQIKNIILTGY